VEAEDEEIRAGVASGATMAEITERLPSRALDAVRVRRASLRVREGPRAWAEAEDASLREGFESGKSWKEMAKAVPGRTEKAMASRATKRLRLKRRDGAASASTPVL
jgi:hypothetical protein